MLQQLPKKVGLNSGSYQQTWATVVQLANTLSRDELLMLDINSLLHKLFDQFTIRLFDAIQIEFNCSCSRERTARALKLLGEQEIMDVFRDLGEVAVACEFCGKRYIYNEAELKLLFEKNIDNQVH
jgi:molecular chaperone Hsp33